MEGRWHEFVSEIHLLSRQRIRSPNDARSIRTMSIPSAAIYMIGYEHLLDLLSPHLAPEVLTPTADANSPMKYAHPSNTLSTMPSSTSQPYLNPTPLVAGGLARTLSATVISPMELFRTRLQALPAGEHICYRSPAAVSYPCYVQLAKLPQHTDLRLRQSP
jgi:hypothetical protein